MPPRRREVMVSQINVNRPGPEPTSTSSDRTAAAGINFLTVFLVLVFLIGILWFLFTGPLRSAFGGSNTNVQVNPPAQQAPPNVNVNPPPINVNPPSAPSNPVNPPAAPSNPSNDPAPPAKP